MKNISVYSLVLLGFFIFVTSEAVFLASAAEIEKVNSVSFSRASSSLSSGRVRIRRPVRTKRSESSIPSSKGSRSFSSTSKGTPTIAPVILKGHSSSTSSSNDYQPAVTLLFDGLSYRVQKVLSNSLADKSGLREGDVIHAINSETIRPHYYSVEELAKMLTVLPKNKKITVDVLRFTAGFLTIEISEEGEDKDRFESALGPNENLVDKLPFNEPRTALSVYGYPTPVIDVCTNMYFNFFPYKIIEDHGSEIKSIQFFDLKTQTLVNDVPSLVDNEWSGIIPSHPFYVRWMIKEYVQVDKSVRSNYSSNHRLGINSGGCTSLRNPIGIYLTPSAISDVTRSGPDVSPLVSGNRLKIGSFTFKGLRSDKSQKLYLKELQFRVHSIGRTKISSVKIYRDDLPTDIYDCLYNDPTLLRCEVPIQISEVGDFATYSISADVIADPSQGALQLVLENFGNPFSRGSVSWMNDDEIFYWMSPVSTEVKGTLYQVNNK